MLPSSPVSAFAIDTCGSVGIGTHACVVGSTGVHGGGGWFKPTALRIVVTPAGNGSATFTLNVKFAVPGVPPVCAGTVSTAFEQLVPAAAPSAQPVHVEEPAATNVVFAGTISLTI